RCHCSGVTAADFWGSQEIFGVHTCPGSQVLIPLTWGSGVAAQVFLLHLFEFQNTFLGSTPVWVHRYRVLPPGAPSTGLRCCCSTFSAPTPAQVSSPAAQVSRCTRWCCSRLEGCANPLAHTPHL
uniref:Uncharacterized protein n=1 Tax=Catharus ustulatus TaxID=91951 RepID=A0A8C3UXS3_CATUS